MSILTLREVAMNKSKAIKIAIAFKRGAAFIRGMRQLAQDADVPEGARWITIGAAEGDDGKKHGGRNVLIDKESGTIIKGLSKDVQGKTLSEAFKELKKTPEQKAAEQKAAEQKAAEQKAAEQKAAEQKAAEQKAAEQKAAEEKKAAEKYPYWENGKRYGYTYVPSDFWDKWKINKQAIKDAGIQPTKIDGEWKLKVFEGADPKVLDGIKTEKEKASEAQEKTRSEAREKIKELRADNLPAEIFNPGEVAAVDQFAYERKEVEQDYNALKDKRNKLKADIAEESARLEKEGQKTSGALTKMENELEAIRKKIKEHAFSFSAREAQDRFFGEGNYRPGKYGHIRHVIDRDTVILNVAESSVRNTRYGTLLNISHDMMVDVPGFGIKPIRIKTGDDHWEDGYAVKIKRQYYSPKALNSPTDNAAFEKTPTFDDIVRAAKAQDLDQNTTVKVRTIK